MIKIIDQSNDTGININVIINLLIRSKSTVIVSSLIFFIISCIYAISTQRIWEGAFEIVLRSNKTDSVPPNGLSSAANLLFSGETKGIGLNGGINIPTEKVILNSSSVLMPIFEYVKSEKSKVGINMNNVTFKDWKKGKFFIDNPSSTAVLEIRYRDSDKKLISDVLNKVSKTYQEYSGKSKKRELELASNYLNEQINLYQEKSASSLKKTQKFAIEQNLNILLLESNNSESAAIENEQIRESNLFTKIDNKIMGRNIDIERQRIDTVNQIVLIDQQINIIKNLKNDIEQLTYIGSTIPVLVSEGLPGYLKTVDQKLTLQKTKFTPNDRSIYEMEKERNLLAERLRKRAIGILTARRLILEANMKAFMRPKEVLIKYKELLREASRDESTLIGLEEQLRLISLEKAKIDDPWELITKPTIKKNPIYPQRKKIAFFGLISGSIIGLLFAKYKEIKSGKIYDTDQLKYLLDFKNMRYVKDGEAGRIFVNNFIEANDNKPLTLIKNGDFDTVNVYSIKDLNPKKDYKLEENISNIKKENNNLLIVSFDNLYKEDVENIRLKIDLIGAKLGGIIIVD